MRVLSRLFRRRFLEELEQAHRAGQLQFFGEHAALADARAFADWLAPLRKCEWVVYAKRPFAGPEAVLAYLSRYTHRVAISNSRLVAMDERGVTFRWKDYRAKGRTRHKTMTLGADEFMRRFLLHVLPGGFHRIRHYGLLANGSRKDDLACARELLQQPAPTPPPDSSDSNPDHGHTRPTFVCRHCGAPNKPGRRAGRACSTCRVLLALWCAAVFGLLLCDRARWNSRLSRAAGCYGCIAIKRAVRREAARCIFGGRHGRPTGALVIL